MSPARKLRAALIVGEAADLGQWLGALGLCVVTVPGFQELAPRAQELSPGLVVVNLPGAGVDRRGLDQASRLGVPIVVVTDGMPDESMLESDGRGIRVLPRPVSQSELEAAVREVLPGVAAERSGREDGTDGPAGERYRTEFAPLFARSPRMRSIKEIIEEVAGTSATVLLLGESGVGKDLVARAIHALSDRQERPFVKVNCAALPSELLESELFGHEKGSFTGAYRRKLGKFEFANTGSIFLDEIGELSRAVQAKLLHVLQDLEFARIGGREMIRVDARVIAATNRNLEAALTTGEFREDLYYRLNVVEIRIPPLRERREEIAGLAAALLTRFNKQYQRSVTLSRETVALFTEYSWPGNVRELENVVRRLVVLANAQQVHEEILTRLRTAGPPPKTESPGATPDAATPSVGAEVVLGLREIARLAALGAERKALADVLDRVRWNRVQAARILKVSYKTLLKKIAECGLAPGHGEREP